MQSLLQWCNKSPKQKQKKTIIIELKGNRFMCRLDLSVMRFLELKKYMKQKYSAQRQTIGKVGRVCYESVHIHAITIGRKENRAQTVGARIIPEPIKYSILLICEVKYIQIEQRRRDLYPHIIYFNYKTLEKEKGIYFTCPCMQCPQVLEENVRSPGAGVLGNCELPQRGCWELNPALLEEQQCI